jgi:penicillin V acylase-like amidase (Ntn superfamily)
MLVALLVSVGCSDFYMPTNNTASRLSVRTMDLGLDGGWNLTTVPKGLSRTQKVESPVGSTLSWVSKFGYVGFSAPKYGFPMDDAVGEALNEAGLSCGALALTPSKMPPPSDKRPNLHMQYLCQWAVERYDTVSDVRAALESEVALYGHGVHGNDYTHWVLRDATGASLVVETPADGMLHLHDDPNDGASGFGIMTNEPPFEYHVLNAQHLAWKRTLVRQAVRLAPHPLDAAASLSGCRLCARCLCACRLCACRLRTHPVHAA